MITHPFPLLQPFRDQLDVRLLTKEENLSSDDDIASLASAQNLASLHQVHGNRAVVVRSETRRIEQADALATDQIGLTLTIRFADCQNFIVFSPEKKVIGLIHAGWKGLKSGVISSTFSLFKKEWNIDPATTIVCAGPSLCMRCAEFTDPLCEAPELKNYVKNRCIDLQKAADEELFSLGVLEKNFKRLSDCTRCHPETYVTYRGGDREGVERGRSNCLMVKLCAENQELGSKN